MITNLFLRLGWSRDDRHWLWMKVVALAGLVASGLLDLPADPTTLKWVQALAVLVLVLGGQYGNSPLPGRKLSALLMVIGLSVGMTGCATLATATGQGAVTAPARLEELARLVDQGARVVQVAREVQKLEIGLHRQGRVRDPVHQTVQRGFLQFAREAKVALRVAEDVAQSAANRITAIRALLGYGDHLLDVLAHQVPDDTPTDLRTAVAAVRAALAAFQ